MRFRDLVETGSLLFGGWSLISGSFSAEVMGRCGFDWVCLDMQHGFLGLAGTLTPTMPEAGPLAQKLISACGRHGILPGIHATDPRTSLSWREAGFRMINVSVDTVLVQRGAAEALHDVRLSSHGCE